MSKEKYTTGISKYSGEKKKTLIYKAIKYSNHWRSFLPTPTN